MSNDTITLTMAEAENLAALGREAIKLLATVEAVLADTHLTYDTHLPLDARLVTPVGPVPLRDLRRMNRRARKLRRLVNAPVAKAA